MYFHDENSELCSVSAYWTNVFPLDPFVCIADGRSPFRLVDLLELHRLLGMISVSDSAGLDGLPMDGV